MTLSGKTDLNSVKYVNILYIHQSHAHAVCLVGLVLIFHL